MGYEFDWVINRTNVLQVYYDKFSDSPVHIHPGCMIDRRTLKSAHGLSKVKNLISELKTGGEESVYLERTFSVGDTLMVVPVVRRLIELGYKARVRTTREYGLMMDLIEVPWETATSRGADGTGVILDYLVERDHIYKNLQTLHRCELLFRAIGLDLPETLDWSMDLMELPEAPIAFKEYVVVQFKGSGVKKSLNDATISVLLKNLAENGVKVVVVGEKTQGIPPSKSISFLDRTLSLPNLFSAIAHAKALVCMDSGPLWISHFTNTPTVCIMGPTRPSERLSLHPLYPEGAVAVRLNEEIACEPCFEMAEVCDRRIDCLHVEPSKIWNRLEPAVMKFWEV